jgi:nuclease-like protein
MPHGRGDIDHIAIAPSGIYVIDTKDWAGSVRVRRPLFGAPKLLIAGRDRTHLIDGLEGQIAAVRAALATNADMDLPIQGVLCFTRADLPLLGTTRLRGHLLIYRKALAKRLNADGHARTRHDLQARAPARPRVPRRLASDSQPTSDQHPSDGPDHLGPPVSAQAPLSPRMPSISGVSEPSASLLPAPTQDQCVPSRSLGLDA